MLNGLCVRTQLALTINHYETQPFDDQKHTVASQAKMLVVYIQRAQHHHWRKTHRVVVASVHVLDQLLSCLQHLVLMTPVGLFVPKHTVMLHLTQRASFFGNPSWCAARDEGCNRDLTCVLRHCNQVLFEERAILNLGSVFDRSKHRSTFKRAI